MSRALIALGLLVAPALAPLPARGDEPALPTPPRQGQPWTPPTTTLPRFLASATAALCDQGLADPRGCDYRRVKLRVGSVWGGAGEVETGGWVLPAGEGGPPRHAIAWSGLVYPLVADLGPGDLVADVRAIAAAPSRGRPFDVAPTNEAFLVDVRGYGAVKVCLLLRMGRGDLAESLWARANGEAPGEPAVGPGVAARPKIDLTSYGVSYLTLARDLAWCHFDRAICAHMRGDDPVALADARFLAEFGPAVERHAAAMGFERPEGGWGAGQPAAPRPYIDFLGPLPGLLADQERRARERAAGPPAPRGDGPEARVAALVRDLDQVAARQWGQPGGVVLGESPIIRELISLGDVAVEPLIRDLRTDDRLTRSVGFHRDFHRDRTILRADQAAYTALTGILRVTNFAPPAADGSGGPRPRGVVADEIQAYWDKNRAVPLVERWYRTLLDDKAGARAWLEAASTIVQPENVRVVPGGGAFAVTETTQLAPGERPKLRGEPLRLGHEPTVAALLARRVEALAKTEAGQNFELLDPCRLAAALAEWDPVAGLPTLRTMMHACRERYARPAHGRDWTTRNLAVSIARFALARDRAGDADALREYAEFIRTTTPEDLEDNALAVLEPLHRRPDDPALAAAAAWLFGDPRSPWAPLIGREGSRTTYHRAQLIASPLVAVPAFRAMLRAALDDRTPAGTAEAKDGSVNVQLDGGLSMGVSRPQADPDAPGGPVPIRRCDFYAWRLATLEGAPAFDPCWPPDRRDAALAATAAFLEAKGAR